MSDVSINYDVLDLPGVKLQIYMKNVILSW
jgi:hypothetical protein